MIIDKPTTEQLESAKEVIDWLVEFMEENEPDAFGFIVAGKTFSEEMPTSTASLD